MKRKRGRCWLPCAYDKVRHSAHCMARPPDDGSTICVLPPLHKGGHAFGSPLLADRGFDPGGPLSVAEVLDLLRFTATPATSVDQVAPAVEAGSVPAGPEDRLFLCDVILDYVLRGVPVPRGIIIIMPIPEEERGPPGPDQPVAHVYGKHAEDDDADQSVADTRARERLGRERRRDMRRVDDRILADVMRRVIGAWDAIRAAALAAGDTISHEAAIAAIRDALIVIPTDPLTVLEGGEG